MKFLLTDKYPSRRVWVFVQQKPGTYRRSQDGQHSSLGFLFGRSQCQACFRNVECPTGFDFLPLDLVEKEAYSLIIATTF